MNSHSIWAGLWWAAKVVLLCLLIGLIVALTSTLLVHQG